VANVDPLPDHFKKESEFMNPWCYEIITNSRALILKGATDRFVFLRPDCENMDDDDDDALQTIVDALNAKERERIQNEN
jgi:hypothetical protein